MTIISKTYLPPPPHTHTPHSHSQMMELYPEEVTEDLLPTLPSIPRGIWSYLLSVDIRPGLYGDLAKYLTTLSERCSVENVLAVFFADSFLSPVKYEEQWSELKRRHYQVCVCGVVVGWGVGVTQ